MSAATVEIDMPERAGEKISLPVAAATKILAGTLVARNTSGNAVPASDTTLLVVVGRAEETIDNTAGAAGDLAVVVKRGVFRLANSGTAAVDADDEGKFCYVEDDQTVGETSTHKVKAGRVVDVDDDGVWVDTSANFVTQADSITGAADLAALKTALATLLSNAGIAIIK